MNNRTNQVVDDAARTTGGVEGTFGVQKRLLAVSGGTICAYEAGQRGSSGDRFAARGDV